jgi:hypothetical protein
VTSSSSPIVRPSSPASRVATRSLTRRPAAALDPRLRRTRSRQRQGRRPTLTTGGPPKVSAEYRVLRVASRAPLGAAWPAPVRLPLCLDAGLASAPVIHVGRPCAVRECVVVLWPIGGAPSTRLPVALRVSCAADGAAAAIVGVARRAVFGRRALSVKSEFRGVVGRSTRGIGIPAAAGPLLCLRRLGVTNSMPRDGAKSGTESDESCAARRLVPTGRAAAQGWD